MLENLPGVSLLFEPYSDKPDFLSIDGKINSDCISITEFELLEIFCESIYVSNVILNTVYIEPSDERFLRFMSKANNYRLILVIDNSELKYWINNFTFKNFDNVEICCFDIYGHLLFNKDINSNISYS